MMHHTTFCRRAARGAAAAIAASLLQAGAALAAPDPAAPPAASRVDGDLAAVQVYRRGMARTVAFARANPQLFPAARPEAARVPTPAQRGAVIDAWRMLLDYVLALDAIGQAHADFHRIADDDARRRSFLVRYAAFVAQYRHALEFIDLAERDPALGVILDEPVPALGLPQGSYARFKYRFLNVVRGTEFAALSALHRVYWPRADSAALSAAAEDAARLWQLGRGRGELLTVRNGLDILRDATAQAFFPVQAGVSEWMGDTKVARPDRSLVAPAQIEELAARLEPGDILLERREWFISNVGLPGYWPHAALYVGTAEQRGRFFDDPEVARWVRSLGVDSGRFEELLQRDRPRAHAVAQSVTDDGHPARVLEAISEGVSFTSLEHSADADSVAVLRPRLSRHERAVALYRAFGYHGRPYDFDFDFLTDSALVCTELIFKAYQPGAGYRGLVLPLREMAGRSVTPANELARLFDEEAGGPQRQFELVAFLDGREWQGRAVAAGEDAFRGSWRRPKWHIWFQER